MPPKAAVEDFDDDFEFDLPTISSGNAGASAAVPQQGGQSQADQMAAFQKMMEQMGQAPGSGDFGSSRAPVAPGPVAGGSGKGAQSNDGEHKKWVSVYPIYFDAKRHYGKGCRRVAYEKSSPFPTQLWLAKAAGRLNLQYVQEPYKTHPQDWENPGRIKVKLFEEDGTALDAKIQNKKQLFDALAEIIQPECGGRPPAVEARKKRTKPSTLKKLAFEANAKAAASSSAASGSTSAPASGSKKKGKAQQTTSSTSTVKVVKPTLTKAQRKEILAAKRDPNPNPIRARLAKIRFPPTLEARLPAHSPAIEGGLLNMNLAEAMGGLPPGMGGADALGPLGGMLGSMGLGGADDDEDDDDQQDQIQDDAAKKKDPTNPLNLGRRQRKKVVRIGR
ncbi:hypothetical protein BCV70DRAFT_203049 [Testicularia cyperi]|uniref:Signal recognition particle, SRP19 subunit n=1 Tax=Testicularia cyperi TaxID=1882483 RepID=A0A317XFT2_9BASI|nr:hypothetical protein BCV70DRAFT_203049 [Testicularia cyperi]